MEMWTVLLGICLPFSIAEIVVKSDGMLNARMSFDDCGLSIDEEVEAIDEIQNFTRPHSGHCGWYNKGHSLRISGGDIYTPENEFPFISAVVKRSGGVFQPFCGGSILSRTHILTAAHCTDGVDSANLFVLVGSYDIYKPSTSYIPVSSIARHSLYDRNTLMNDIAVLSLKTPIRFTQNVGPVCLPEADIDDGDVVKILGWGAEKYKGQMSSKPREMDTETISIAECYKQWGTCVRRTKPIQMCTYSKSATPCQGDSGGPVVWLDPQTNLYSLVGIVSYGPQCTELKAAVHTKVTSFLPWIQQLTQDV